MKNKGDFRMVKGNKAWEVLVGKLELPGEIIMGLPLLALGGNRRLYIESHLGLIEYSDTIIRLRVKQGQVIIIGKGFFIEELQEKEVLASGKIQRIEFDFSEGE